MAGFDSGFNPYMLNRMSGIFSGTPNPAPSSQQTFSNPFKRLLSGVTPTPASNPAQSNYENGDDSIMRYMDMLQKVSANRPAAAERDALIRSSPTPQQYAPTTGRKIGGALAAFGTALSRGPESGLQMGEYVNSAPYRTALAEYEPKLESAKSRAETEGQGISDFRQNLTSAASIANQSGELGLRRGTLENQQFTARTGRYAAEQKAKTDYDNTMSEIQRRKDQTSNEATLAELKRQENAATAAYQRNMAAAASVRAGAAVTAAGAAQERALHPTGREPKMPDVGEQQGARNLALEQLKSEDPLLGKYIDVNTGEYGPVYNVKENIDNKALQQINNRVDEILRRSYPKYQPFQQSNQPVQDSGSDWVVGPMNFGQGGR